MPEVIFAGPEGRLEGRYHPQKAKDAPIAIVLHPHPQFGGTMNNRVVYNLHYAFHKMGFTVLRFNFRGVGRSQGEYDQGIGELSDAASALFLTLGEKKGLGTERRMCVPTARVCAFAQSRVL